MVCGFLLFGCGVSVAYFLAQSPTKSAGTVLWLITVSLALASLGVYSFLSSFRSKVILFADRIEVMGVARARRMGRQDILGWRSAPTAPETRILVPRDTAQRKVKIWRIFPFDAEFARWFSAIPCLDAQDTRAAKAQIRNDPAFGATPGARMQLLGKKRKQARTIGVGALALCVWGCVYPVPYGPAILALALLPWIGLAILKASRGLFRLDPTHNDFRPNLSAPIMIPAFALALRANDFNVVHSWAVLWTSLVVAVLLCLSAILVDSNLRRLPGAVAAFALIALIYGYGVSIEANVLLDHSQELSYRVQVQERRIIHGKTTTYEVQLEPWGPRPKPNRLRIPFATYKYIRPGDTLNVVLRHGAFGISWYYMRAWDRGINLPRHDARND